MRYEPIQIRYNGQTYSAMLDTETLTIIRLDAIVDRGKHRSYTRRVRLDGPKAAKVANANGYAVPEKA